MCKAPHPGTLYHYPAGSGPSTQHAPAGNDRVQLGGDGGLPRYNAESVSRGMLSVSTQNDIFAEPAPSLLLQVEGSAGNFAPAESSTYLPHSQHLPDRSDDLAVHDMRHSQDDQHGQHAQDVLYAQHTQHMQHIQHVQETEDNVVSLAIPSQVADTLDEAVHLAPAASAALAQPAPAQQKAYAAGAGRAVQGRGLTTLAPSSDIGLSATDVSFTDRDIRVLLQQLDSFAPDDMFLERFAMLGPEQRRRGGVLCHAVGCRRMRRTVQCVLCAGCCEISPAVSSWKVWCLSGACAECAAA